MKLLIVLLLLSSSVFAQVKVISVDPDVKLDKINLPNKQVMKKKKRQYLSYEERDILIDKYFKKEFEKMNELDKDIFYRCVVHYDYKRFKKKYTFATSEKSFSRLKWELKNAL